VLQLVLGQVLNGAIIGAMYGIIALGITLTFGITGIVNFALGQFMMIGAYAAWHLTDITRLPYDGDADRWFNPQWLVASR